MDDANIPSLLSAPYIGYTKSDSFVYKNTRRFLLSKDNPYYYVGSVARGIGSAHTNDGYVWPLALIMQGFTATSGQPNGATCSRSCSRAIPATISCTSRSIRTIPTKFSRQDFGWPNALFSEFVMTTFNGFRSAAGGRYERSGVPRRQ
jgi:meiotically up-regulated gene 157 (Mug157) protein